MLCNSLVAATGLAVASFATAQSPTLPVVDLGYELHQAAYFNATGGFYNFSNIRYGEPPVGDMRFRAPVSVSGSRNASRAVNNGSVGKICPQATPAWELIAAQFIPAYLSGIPFNASTVATSSSNSSSAPSLPPIDPRTTEDCLFLDVVVPQAIFHKASNTTNDTCGAPVLVWIYGGGYTAGDKSGSGNPAGLIKASQVTGSEGVIYVSMNYRLGAFGWLSGPTLQSDGTANAGLYDQRLALEWVQENIHLFGGDPNRVTVIGQSAGGGSIMHQITAFGGLKGPAPFQQAIPQSPGFLLVPGNLEQEVIFQTFLALLNVSTLEEARRLPSSALVVANLIQVANSSYGDYTYGPVVDGLFAPALPGKLLLQGSYDKDVNIMVGHNADEGLVFTSPFITNNTEYDSYLTTSFPTIDPAVVNYIANVLYPPVFKGSYPYTSQTGRTILSISESTFTCNTVYLDHAFGNKTYSYQFSVPPATHGQDVPYTYFNGPSSSVLNDTVAIALQEYITSFTINGVPSGPSIPMFPLYGNNSEVLNLNISRISQIMDPNANARCAFWQKGLIV
ncbi:MAG: carboxylesterase family [Lasallia pustulata]|uniref:Carboxylic ester hydrolase n=1 Tax=Lasallia pustulata TaxID=136370 RepID=A0A5M8PJJ6_9LECA|nr:MAG: carboxylesterase family [Lasallia pustulata]